MNGSHSTRGQLMLLEAVYLPFPPGFRMVYLSNREKQL